MREYSIKYLFLCCFLWLKNGTVESLAYEFDKPYTVSKVEVYWLDFDHYDGDFRFHAIPKINQYVNT